MPKFNIIRKAEMDATPPKKKKITFNVKNKADELFKTMSDMAGTNMTHANQPSVGGFGDTYNIDELDERDLEIYNLVPDEEDSNWWDSILYNEDFTGIMTEKEGRWYIRARLTGFDNLSRKGQDKWEGLEEKIMTGVNNLVSEHHTKAFNKWKGANKGMRASMKNFKDSFRDYYESY